MSGTVQSLKEVAGPIPDFTHYLMSLDITASTPPRGHALPPRPPPPTDGPLDAPALVTAPPLSATLPEPVGPPAANTDGQDIVLIAAAVAGGVGLLLLGVIALYCSLMRIRRSDAADGTSKQVPPPPARPHFRLHTSPPLLFWQTLASHNSFPPPPLPNPAGTPGVCTAS